MNDTSVERSLSTKHWSWFWFLILIGFLLRWLELDTRPIHHDESLHAMYGHYFYDWPDEKFYKYDPMLHGPVLYNLYPLVYLTLGITDWSIRAPIALLGTVLMFVPFLFRRYLSAPMLLTLTGAVAFSPTLVYWSRLVHHDLLVLSGMLMMLYGAVSASKSLRPFWILSGVALQFSVKANIYITLALILGYLLYEFVLLTFMVKDGRPLLMKMFGYISQNILPLLAGVLSFALIAGFFYSSGFRYSGALFGCVAGDNACHPWYESFTYWLHHHSIERIAGPFMFHFYMLSWYELPFVAIFITHALAFYAKADKEFRWLGVACFALAIGLAEYYYLGGFPLTNVQPWAFFKAKDALDVFGIVFIIAHAVIVTTQHIFRQEQSLGFFGYFFFGTLFAYSYAGEKTPWLSIYPFTAGLLYYALYFDKYLKDHPIHDWSNFPIRKILTWTGALIFLLGFWFTIFDEGLNSNWFWLASGLVIAGIGLVDCMTALLGNINLRTFSCVVVGLFLIRISILTNFVYAGKSNELISQVHTTPEFDRVMKYIRSEMLLSDEEHRPQCLVSGEGVWPTVWYLHGLPLRYDATPDQRKDYRWIIQDFKEAPTDVPPGFTVQKLRLRGWWVPDYTQMSLKRFLGYAVNHLPWKPGWGGDPSGYSYVTFLSRESK